MFEPRRFARLLPVCCPHSTLRAGRTAIDDRATEAECYDAERRSGVLKHATGRVDLPSRAIITGLGDGFARLLSVRPSFYVSAGACVSARGRHTGTTMRFVFESAGFA